MVDRIDKEKRSKIMSKIKSKWTTQEVNMHNLLKGRKVKHKMHPKIDGRPDIVLTDKNTAVFLHG